MKNNNSKVAKSQKTLFLLSCIVLGIISFIGCNSDAIPSELIDKDEIIKEYKNDSERFKKVAEYLQKINENVFIERLEDRKFSVKKSQENQVKQIEINDNQVKSEIEYILYELNFKYISEDGINGIYFTKQTSLQFAQGIAYSKDNNKPDWGTIEELKQITGSWYYFKGY